MSLTGITLALAMTLAASFEAPANDLLPNITDEQSLIAALRSAQTPQNHLRSAQTAGTNFNGNRTGIPSPPPPVALNQGAKTSKSMGNGIGSAVSLATMTILAAASIFGLAFLIRRYRASGSSLLSAKTRGDLQLLDSLWVARGLRLMVVRAGDQRLVLGSSSQGLSTLAVLDDESAKTTQKTNEPKKTVETEMKTSNTFENMLKQETRSANPLSSRKLQDVLHRLNSL